MRVAGTLADSATAGAVLIIYDGECTFCKAYTQLLQLKQSVGVIELLSARADDVRVQHYAQRGYDLDDGMLVVSQNEVYAGAEAIHWLSERTSGSGVFAAAHRLLFNRLWLARCLYPPLKLGRRFWLALRGRKLIRDSHRPQNSG